MKLGLNLLGNPVIAGPPEHELYGHGAAGIGINDVNPKAAGRHKLIAPERKLLQDLQCRMVDFGGINLLPVTHRFGLRRAG